jgi:rRNA biogenesis protein RRP5
MAPIEKKRKRITDEDEEAAFPRGGASVLTPLEHKQIQIEATRDVLFEQQSSKSKVTADGETSLVAGRKRLKSKQKGKSKQTATEPEEETIKIEGLNYKVCLASYPLRVTY